MGGMGGPPAETTVSDTYVLGLLLVAACLPSDLGSGVGEPEDWAGGEGAAEEGKMGCTRATSSSSPHDPALT